MTAATTAAAMVVGSAVDQCTHDVASARQQHERDEGERDPERQDHLRDHQCARRVHPGCDDHDRRRQRHEPAHDQRDPPPEETLHHDLAGVGADSRRCGPRCEQRQSEQERGGRPEGSCQAGMRFLDRVNGRRLRREHLRGNQEHRQVDHSCDAHREHDVDALAAQEPQPLMLRAAQIAALGESSVKVDDVGHDRGAQHPGGEQHRVRALEPRHQARDRLARVDAAGDQAVEEPEEHDEQHAGDGHLERTRAATLHARAARTQPPP